MLFITHLIMLSVLVPSPATAVGGAARTRPAAAADMVAIPAGVHERLYGDSRTSKVRIARFALDKEPVTRGGFLSFVRETPAWRKSSVTSSGLESGYLADWRGDLDAGTPLRGPVTAVSWYAATAYCEARGKRLPTVNEWEYAATASESKANATRDGGFINRLLGLYGERSSSVLKPVGSGFRNIYGVRGMHDLAWEWTSDFRPAAAPHDNAHVSVALKGHKHDMFCASSAIGASDPSNYPAFMRYAVRAGLNRRSTMRTLGFRCAANLA